MQVAHSFRSLQLKASGSLRGWWRVGSRISPVSPPLRERDKRQKRVYSPTLPLQLPHSEQRKGNRPIRQGAPTSSFRDASLPLSPFSQMTHDCTRILATPAAFPICMQHQMPHRVPNWRPLLWQGTHPHRQTLDKHAQLCPGVFYGHESLPCTHRKG